MNLHRRIVRLAAFVIPVGMFVAVPVFDLWASPLFGLYIVGYLIVGGLLAALKWKVDGTIWW